MIDIYNNSYSIEELTDIIKNTNISQTAILTHQKLTPEYCINYILNEDYSLFDCDRYLDINDILTFQPHITKTQLTEKI
jgi:hypothetical protein